MKQIILEKSVHAALWGAESWEISAHPSDSSVIAEGTDKGRRLNEVYSDFPLLFKVIDARTRLSVQVHPNEATCKLTGGEPKTEMWCALSDGPIYAGLKKGTRATDVEKAVESGRFEELLVRHEAKFGDVFFIPGGLVHAIGDGVRLYEVQQSSDTTFRLYDWGRVGADGKARELHIEKGLRAIDYSLPPPSPCMSLRTPFFDFSQMTLGGEGCFETGSGEFLALFAARGEVDVDGRVVGEGMSLLVPPSASCRVAANGSHVLVTRFPAASHVSFSGGVVV